MALTGSTEIGGRHSTGAGRSAAALLEGLGLAALDELNPDAVTPHLKELGRYIHKNKIAAIQRGIDNFDFKGAKQEAEKLAKQILSIAS